MNEKIDELIEIGKQLYEQKFISATEGNLSYRISDKEIYTTKSGVCKGKLTKDDLTIINLDGQPKDPTAKPSTEYKLHTEVYKNRPEIQAVIHAHPPYVISLSLAGMAFDRQYLPESVLLLGNVPVAKYAIPSTDKVAESIRPYIKKTDILILERHGSVAIGKSLEEAFYKTAILEKTAHIIWLASRLGPLIPLDPREVKEILKLREKVYGLDFPLMRK